MTLGHLDRNNAQLWKKDTAPRGTDSSLQYIPESNLLRKRFSVLGCCTDSQLGSLDMRTWGLLSVPAPGMVLAWCESCCALDGWDWWDWGGCIDMVRLLSGLMRWWRAPPSALSREVFSSTTSKLSKVKSPSSKPCVWNNTMLNCSDPVIKMETQCGATTFFRKYFYELWFQSSESSSLP